MSRKVRSVIHNRQWEKLSSSIYHPIRPEVSASTLT